jgi:hypothetical protein
MSHAVQDDLVTFMRVQGSNLWAMAVSGCAQGFREKGSSPFFSGIRNCNLMGCKNPYSNPKGIASLSPGLARFREGLPRGMAVKATTLKGLHIKPLPT